jgi:hypothetical protein
MMNDQGEERESEERHGHTLNRGFGPAHIAVGKQSALSTKEPLPSGLSQRASCVHDCRYCTLPVSYHECTAGQGKGQEMRDDRIV